MRNRNTANREAREEGPGNEKVWQFDFYDSNEDLKRTELRVKIDLQELHSMSNRLEG